MAKLSYWERRQAQNMYEYMQSAEAVSEEIAKLYRRASGYISTMLDEIFEKYQTKHNLTDDEARQLLSMMHDKTSIADLMEKLREVSAKDENRKAILAQLESAAYQSRLERLQQLQNQIDYIMSNVYQQEKDFNTSHYVDLANESYYKGIYDIQQMAGAAFSFNYVDAKTIDRVINSKWSGKNYSQRIWGNTKAFAQDIKEELLINLVTGRTNREVADIIANKYHVEALKARRLVRTESNYVATELNFKAYEDVGVEKYKYLATLDLRTSEICRNMDGKIFPVSERTIGVNCPPLHPWCRSTTICVISEELLEKLQRSARDPETGELIKVPLSMTYEQWYDKYVKGNTKAQAEEQKIKNRASDRKQHKEYRELLGDSVPEKIDDFQDMKYTNSEKWKFIKLDYSRQIKLMEHPELKLPNADRAVLPDGKFTDYLLGGTNPKGLAKGAAFSDRLGYGMNNWKDLQSEIFKGASKYPAIQNGSNPYGMKYEQKMVLQGKKGTPANVVVGWLQKLDGSMNMTSAYVKEVK